MSNVVNHVGLCVTDADRSRAFYEGVFGFEHRNDLLAPDDATSPLLRIRARWGSGPSTSCSTGSCSS